MNGMDPNIQVGLYKPPVPRARPSIRKFNISGEKHPSLQNSDNFSVMDKMHKVKQQSQESFDIANNSYTDDDSDDDTDDHYSNESLNDSLNSFIMESSFSTPYNSPDRIQLRNRSFQSPNTSLSFNVTNNSSLSYKHIQNQPIPKSHQKYNYLFLFIIIIITVVCYCCCIPLLSSKEATQKTIGKNEIEKNESNKLDLIDKILDKKMQIIRKQFYNQKPNIWNDISAGLYDVVLYPKKPSIITLFGNEIDTLNCLAQFLGQLSGLILGSNDYLILTPEDFPNDVGETIYNLKVPISQKRAVVVTDLLSINVEAIKAFHNFCDRKNPLIEHAIYIITVIVDGYKPLQRELEFIERHMINKLSGKIEKDILDPLVTRLTDGVIVPVLSESAANFKHTNCSLPTQNEL